MIEFRHEPGSALLTAHDAHTIVGYLSWWPPHRLGGTHLMPAIAPYELSRVEVRPDHQRRGLATAMFNYVQARIEPRLKHSPHMTRAGAEWSASMGYSPAIHTHVADLGGEGLWSD